MLFRSDGDQNKAGGDAGQAVFTYNYPGVALPPASISGFFQGTTGGPDLSGVLITLSGMTTGGQSVSLTTYTAADGSYRFTGLQPGTYSVTETVPIPGYLATSAVGTVNGSFDGTNSGASITNIVLNAGDNGINYDFNDFLPGS